MKVISSVLTVLYYYPCDYVRHKYEIKHWYMCVCCYFNTSINCVKLNAKVFLGPIFWLEPCLCSHFHPCAMSHSIHPLYILKLLTGEVNKITNFHNNAIFCSEMFGPSIYRDGTLTHTTHLNIAADQSHLHGYSTHNMYSITLQKTKQKNPPKSIQNGWSNMTKRPKCQSSNHFSIFLKHYRSSSAQLRIRGF